MLNKKWILCALLYSQAALSGGMGSQTCREDDCVKPKQWEIGVDALYLRPALSTFSYLGDTSLSTINGITRRNFFEQDHDWGYRIEGSLFFGTNNDIKINWNHFSNTTRSNFSINYDIIDGILNDAVLAIGTVKWDNANFEFGHKMRFDQDTSVRFHGGLHYADINITRDLDASNIFGTATIAQQFKFDGIGPRVGMDIIYNIVESFQLYAKGSTGVLLGSSKVSDIVSFSTNPTHPGFMGDKSDSTIPIIGVDVGASFQYTSDFGFLSIQGGWHFIDYLSALTNGISDSNFSVQGPYVGLKWGW